MKITFLGTGGSTGLPIIGCSCEVCNSKHSKDHRLRTSIHLQTDTLSLVIDSGPDFRQQCLTADIRNLDGVLFTHQHRDHTGGLDDTKPFSFFQKKPLPVYGSKAVLEQLQQDYAYIFSTIPTKKTLPRVTLHEIDPEQTFSIEQLQIVPLLGFHASLPVLGFRIGDFTYITDVNQIPEASINKMMGSKILVLGTLQQETSYGHYSLPEAIEVAQAIKAEKTYFIHIGHGMGLHNEVEDELPPNIHLAYDGLALSL